MNKKFINLEKNLKIKFKNKNLLDKALTHKSYDSSYNYEKLEFLGDRVLGLIISKKLLKKFPGENEGILDKKLASLVNKNKCYEVGKSLNLKNFIKVGNVKKNITNAEKKIISDCVEAIIGAIYLDKGIEQSEKFILKNWHTFIEKSELTQIDAKTRLQEYSLKKFKNLPEYKLVLNTGPRHNPIFKIAVKLNGTKFIEGTGSSKKNAEQNAATKMLNFLDYELAR